MKQTIFITILIALLVYVVGLFIIDVTHETPNERVERINSMANHECSQYPEHQARDCFSWYYSQIEDRR